MYRGLGSVIQGGISRMAYSYSPLAASFIQLFALYPRGHGTYCASLPSGYRRLAILFYGVSAAGDLANRPASGRVGSRRPHWETVWKVSSIVAASALVSIFVMGAFALLAWVRDLPRAKSRPAR